MGILVNVAAEVVGVSLIYIVISKMKSRIITETQAIPWLISALVIMILGFFPQIVNIAAGWFGVWYPPTILFVIFIVLIVFIIFNHSSTMSKLGNQVAELSMQIAILKDANQELKTKLDEIKNNQKEEGGECH